MSRTILAEVDGFTPLLDCLVQEFGVTTAAVFGRVWRYCQMKDEVCYAATATLGEELGLSPHTISNHLDKLVNSGYLEEIQRIGQPSLFRDTGKAGITVKLSGGPVQKLDRTYPKNVHLPIQKLDTKIEDKKEEDSICNEPEKPPVVAEVVKPAKKVLSPEEKELASKAKELVNTFLAESKIVILSQEWPRYMQMAKNMVRKGVTPEIVKRAFWKVKRNAPYPVKWLGSIEGAAISMTSDEIRMAEPG